jgi:hypothetical protein
LYDRLANRFGESQVFIDVATIEPGVDFAGEIFRAVAACKVPLAIIGPNWLTAADERGGRRLDDPDDIVRLEVEAALARAVRVIPILFEGAVMPTRQDLPHSLAGLARRNAILIRHDSFSYDAGRLATAIEPVMAPAPIPAAVASGPDLSVRASRTRRRAHPGHAATPRARGSQRPDSGNALGEVVSKGAEPARNDLARAGRLLTEAERIANSITYASAKASALRDVAKALAATSSQASDSHSWASATS